MNTHTPPPTGTIDPAPDRLLDGVALVIFDFDGVIADSEVISLSTLRDALAELDMEMPLEEVRANFLGRSLATISAHVKVARPGADLEAFAHSWQSDLFAQFKSTLKPVRHVGELLEGLSDQGLAHCIASSSTFERLGVALDAIGYSDRFDHVFSAEQVRRGKPSPDLFLHAAKTLGVSPEHCLVIEDSPFGIEAAKAAGMRSVGFVGGAHLDGMEGAHGTRLSDHGAEAILTTFEPLAAHLRRM